MPIAFGFGEAAIQRSKKNAASVWPTGGSNGSGAYADIDADVAVAVMRNRFDATDMTTLAQIDRIVLDELS